MPLMKYIGNKLPWEKTSKLVLRGGGLVVNMGESANFTDEEVGDLSGRYNLIVTTDPPVADVPGTYPVNITGNPLDGQVPVWDAALGLWVPESVAGAGGGANTFVGLTDVDPAGLEDGETFVWDAATQTFKPQALPNSIYALSRVTAIVSTTNAAFEDATGLSVTFEVEAGDGPVNIRAGCGRTSAAVNAGGVFPVAYRFQLTDDMNVQVARAARTIATALSEDAMYVEAWLDLAPGIYTYKLRHHIAGSGGTPMGYMPAEATNPAFIVAQRG